MRPGSPYLLRLFAMGLCVLALVAFSLLLIERRQVDSLSQRIAILEEENAVLRAQLSPPAEPAPAREAPPAGGAVTLHANTDMENPLVAAVLAGDTDAVRRSIESGAPLAGVQASGEGLLHLAVQAGNPDVLALLLDAGLEVSTVDDRGRTPLHVAAESGQAEAARQLIELGADLEAVDGSGRTPLATAVQHENADMAEVLLGAGANAGVTGAFDQSLLHVAAKNGDTGTVRVLLNGGIDPGVFDNRGRNALHYAAPAAVAELAASGLDVNQQDGGGRTPIYNALLGGEGERAGALFAAGADGSPLLEEKDDNLLRAARFGLTDLGGYLVGSGADVNAGAEAGKSALDIAVEYGHTGTAELLLSHGAESAASLPGSPAVP